VAKALQGKTPWRSADYIMSDDHHNTVEYLEHLYKNASCPVPPRIHYWAMALVPLYLYGHLDKAVEVGTEIIDGVCHLWSLRVSFVLRFYLSLAILCRHFDNPTQHPLGSQLDDVLKYKAEIDYARSCCDANYAMWSLLLEALLSEVSGDFAESVQAFEVG
jgi:hypothetical protein